MEPVSNPPKGCIAAALWLGKQVGVGVLSGIATVFAGFGTLAASEIPLLAGFVACPAAVSIAALFRRQAVGALLLGPAIAIVAVIPLITTTGGHNGPTSGCEQMLVEASGAARIAYANAGTHKGIRTLTGPPEQGGCGVAPSELQGRYFRIRDEVVVTATGASLVAEPLPGNERWGKCTYTFAWEGGQGEFVWSPP